jgi:hypothetical protein
MPCIANPADLPGEDLNEANRTRLLSDEAYALKSQGRLEEALGPQSMVHQRTWESGDRNNFCRSAENLVSMLVPLGRWAEAEAVSREAVSVANGIEDKDERWQRTTTALAYLGHTLHGRGYLKQASTAYKLAEIVQAEAHHHPKLYSIYGYNYTQLLLEQACQETGWREVLARRHTSLDIAVKLNHALSQALDHGAIGLARAALGEPDTVLALDLAVTTMQRAGTVIHLPAMHLARAHYQRNLHDLPAARADLEAAQAIALRGNMRTYLAECALLGGNLLLDEARIPEAAAHHASAAQLIREDGYGRRLTELHLLHARLLHARRDPAALHALADAQARIRETGQWYFWRELRAAANEIAAHDPGECPASGNY